MYDIYIYIYIVLYDYIYCIIYIHRYHTMTDVYTAALLPTKPSSDDDSGFRHDFRAEASLPLTQSVPAVTHNTTRLCWLTSLCGIAISTLMQLESYLGSFLYIFSCLSPRLVKNTELELVMKPRHPTSIGNTLVIQPFLTHCSHRSSYFSNLC